MNIMRRAGYAFQRREGAEMSFIMEMARGGYPRFHAYVHMEGMKLVINLHLDHKKETYGDATRHHGEYEDSPTVQKEKERILSLIS